MPSVVARVVAALVSGALASRARSLDASAIAALALAAVPSHALDATSFGRFRTWPITAVHELEPQLRAMGLELPASEIDGTSSDNVLAQTCLSDALVSVGQAGRGGTGSFISKDGLILTNWHARRRAGSL